MRNSSAKGVGESSYSYAFVICRVSEELIEQMGRDAEAGHPGVKLVPVDGQPWFERDPIVTKSIRVPQSLWELLERRAKEQGKTVSESARESLLRSVV